MIVEFEVSKPLQKRPGRHTSNVQRRWWWLWFAIAVTKGNAATRNRYTWEDQ